MINVKYIEYLLDEPCKRVYISYQDMQTVHVTPKVNKMTKATKRTTSGLREVLFDQIDGLISGKITPQQAKAVSGLASQVVSVTRLEMEAARFISDGRMADSGTKKLVDVSL